MNPDFIVIDLFCGAGGVSTGFVNSGKAVVVACINHDELAIESHLANHPETYHFNEDITKMYGTVLNGVHLLSPKILYLQRLVNIYRAFYPEAKVILWASLECTNFSIAKGGQSRDADSRTLADHLDRYIYVLDPDYIQIENVKEFMSWGALDKKGKPIYREKGKDWMRWRKHISSIGYYDDYRLLDSANYGALTSRIRLFQCFAKPHLPIKFPEPTHGKNVKLFDEIQPWRAVKEVLDFDDVGNSIFNRKKPLSEKSLLRIFHGLTKHSPEKNFILKYNSMNQKGQYSPPSVDEVCPTIACQNRLALIQKSWFTMNYGGDEKYKNRSLELPARTILTTDHHFLTSAFLMKYHGNDPKHNSLSIERPASTLTTVDRLSLIQSHWLDASFTGESNHRSIDKPCGTIMPVNKFALATSFILNPSHGGHCTQIDRPCPVIIARQDKAPLYLIQAHQVMMKKQSLHLTFLVRKNVLPIKWIIGKGFDLPIYPDECETTIKIKTYMAENGIVDITHRMLKVKELKLIQGFDENYVLKGAEHHKKKFIGNSVVPLVVEKWAIELAETIKKQVA